MNLKLVFHIIGTLCMVLGSFMLTPLVWTWYYGDGKLLTWVLEPLAVIFGGWLLRRLTKTDVELRFKESFAAVTLGWIVMGMIGAIPFMRTGALPSFTDAFFESISGFTTTGASVITDVEVLPHGILFWRSLTHWLGGMGIIMLAVAIIPFLGVGGMELFRAEVPGPVTDRLTPRIASTAKILWVVYVAITVLEIVLLLLGGMSLFDAINHAFATVATGGFSTRNLSIGAYHSLYIEVVIVIFMVLSGANFVLHYRLCRGDLKAYWRSTEMLVYLGVLASFTFFITFTLTIQRAKPIGAALRESFFNVASMGTTTGFATADFALWPSAAQFLLIVLMIMGACAGSTCGALKMFRVVVLVRQFLRSVKRQLYPEAVIPVYLDERYVSEEDGAEILGYFFLYIGALALSSFLLAANGLDLLSAVSATAATLGGVGPGLNLVGPMSNYAALPVMSKYVLIANMFLGRLEFYTVLVLLLPATWRK